jgi:hypothetical protein
MEHQRLCGKANAFVVLLLKNSAAAWRERATYEDLPPVMFLL